MRDRTIVIRNVYVMMAYAFGSIHDTGADRLSAVGSASLALWPPARWCVDAWSASSTNTNSTPSTIGSSNASWFLIRRGDVSRARKDALRRLLPYLDTVTQIAPTSIRWDQLIFTRSTASYRMLMGTCELVIRGLLPTEESGSNSLLSWVADEAMSSLYERFLREYFRTHHPELSPAASPVEWDLEDGNASGVSQLPAMRTDITLRGRQHKLVIDAKYYGSTFRTGQYGKESIDSANLYQILAYTKNADVRRDGSASGMLLYARTTADVQPDLDVVIQGNRIGARTLDLNLPWEHLRAQLEEVTNWVE